MGTKVDCKSYLPGYYSMKDLNEDCSSSTSSWPLFYGDNGITNGQYYNGFMPRNSIDDYPGYEKDALKQKMLEHEAVFKNQVYELHRLYRIQRDMMEEVKRKDISTRVSVDPSSSSSLQGSQLPSEDPTKWHMAGFPLLNSGYVGPTVISPVSCTKGNTKTQAGWSPFQNGCSSSKDYEALDLRPLKVRKKLFDLQLPADEYIDTEEGEKGNQKSGPESSMKLYTGGGGGVTDRRIDASTSASASASCSRNSMRLADLNEPIQIEEAMAPSPVDYFGQTSINGETKGIYQYAKSKTSHLDVGGETMFARDKFLGNSFIESKVNEREHLFHLYEAGSSKSNISVSQGHLQEKFPAPSHPGQGMLYPVHHPPAMYPTSYNRKDLWREENQSTSCRNLDRSNNSNLEPVEVSQAPGSFPLLYSQAHSVLPWKPNSFSQKIFESPPLNSAAVMDRCLPISSRGWDSKWMVNSSSRLNPGSSACEATTTPNRFYNGSASASKELHFHLPPAGFDNRNFGRGDNVASGSFTNHFGKLPMEPKPVVDINLNEVLTKNSPMLEKVILQDLNLIYRKSETEAHPSALPWLKPKPAHGNEASSDRLNCKNEAVRDLNQQFTPEDTLVSSECQVMRTKEFVETQNIKKILGFPIFALKNESSSLPSTSASFELSPSGGNVNSERRSIIIDINLECEPDEQIAAAEELIVETEKHSNGIDLNSCLSDSDDPCAPSYDSKCPVGKIPFEIDLEAPPLQESEEDATPVEENTTKEASLQLVENKSEQIQDDVLQNAAEMLVDFSSSPQILANDEITPPTMESFLSFAEAITSCANELESDQDEFETMTLQLVDTKKEDYMPISFIPELPKMDDSGTNTVLTRPRRGQARRGRQRRDFQRDILPGLVSLSRHEVTEDLQIFGGIMKAMGHNWKLGSARRNGTRGGGGRGRRRAAVVETVTAAPVVDPVCAPPFVQQLNSIEAGLEDRSLTGWGKTTRRPRRQRCPAGNAPATVVLT